MSAFINAADALIFRLSGDGVTFDPAAGETRVEAEALVAGVVLGITAVDAQGRSTGAYEIAFRSLATETQSEAPAISSSSVHPASGVTGDVFTSSHAGSDGVPEADVSRQWCRNGVPIDGATDAVYSAGLADIGTISCIVTLSNEAGSVELESPAARVDLDPAYLLGDAGNAMWFDPSDLSEFYVDAGSTVASASGQSIQRWGDKSGVGARTGEQARAASRPSLVFHADGRRSLRFDGADDSLGLSSDVVLGGLVVGCTPDTADNVGVVGSPSGTYVSVSSEDNGSGKAKYRYRSASDTSTSPVPVLTTRAQVASFNCLARDASSLGEMNCYQDGIPADDNPENKELITDCRLIGLRSSSSHYEGNIFGVVSRDRPFSDDERKALQGWMAHKTIEVATGEELHVSDGIPFIVYVKASA